ncbi:ExeA family protein [Marinicellulosiphila megalodicopiae]|uniref:ExeA family protein n=1 Tax=Marinicellulosiphila megalodicopiae TaxID=2724896 RepID=UPI003BB0CCF9
MYLQHFGLDKTPFNITPDTRLFFEGSDRGALLSLLTYAVEQGEGITKVVGEVGTGKTMLCRMLPTRSQDNIQWLYLSTPSLTPDQTVLAIAHEMGLTIDSNLTKFEHIALIQQALLNLHLENKRVVLLVEEAQAMSLETLEEIRLLSNLETDEHKLLQIILFGQPELDEKLKDPQIRQLRERIIHSINIDSLSLNDVHNYLNFRMRSVGYTGPDIFNKKIAKTILKYSFGLTRRVNLIADKILLMAFNENRHNITKRDVKLAAMDHDFYKKTFSITTAFMIMFFLALSLAFASIFLKPYITLQNPSVDALLSIETTPQSTLPDAIVLAEESL